MSFAIDMQRMVSAERWRIGQVMPTTALGFRLVARWWYWHSKETKSGDALRYAKNQYALARDMEAHPDYYAEKPKYINGNSVSYWQWMRNRA